MWIAGIDEAGRGCLCGSLFVAAVVGKECFIETLDVKDSKKLSFKRRKSLYHEILQASLRGQIGFFVVEVHAQEIDKNGLSLGMKKGIEECISNLAQYIFINQILGSTQQTLEIIIDGNTSFNVALPQDLLDKGLSIKTMVRADSLIKVVSCASIVAKVFKDRQMLELSKLYPQYAFEKNKGYGTLEHRRSILEHGYCPYHRKSFTLSFKDLT